jgi:plastocyanin
MYRNTWITRIFLVVALLLTLNFASHAGQVRVDVGGATDVFTPANITVNPGDHVVWVWMGGFHSVTSGASAKFCDSGTSDGIFDSGTTATNVARGTAFSWKSPASSSTTIDYMCLPHCSVGMVGTVTFGSVPVANFRITEVQTNLAGNLDLIEITNFGGAAGDLGRYRIVTADTATVPFNTWSVPAGQRVTLRLNMAGTQVPPNTMYLPTQSGLDDIGYLALYAPNTISSNLALDDQMIDFVQWGAGGSAREATAVLAGLWTAGTFIPQVAAGHSMEFCASAGDHGAQFWAEVAVPNFGTDGDCTTPTVSSTWGRLKLIYR